MVGKTIRAFLPADALLPYVTAIMRVYNRFGRRDNKYKARIKILVHEIGVDAMSELVEAEFARGDHEEAIALAQGEVERIEAYFAPPAYEALPARDPRLDAMLFEHKAFARWVKQNTAPHKVQGYAIANISLKPIGGIPGDATAEQMRLVADLAETYSFGEIRVAHEQNLVLPDVPIRHLYDLWQALEPAGLATPNLNLVSDIIACPGMDYCSLATARSIPVAQAISRRFADLDRQEDIGDLHINISGCINACGHHHVAHLGILGLEKKGVESYQITLGGSGDENAAIGQLMGPGFAADEIVDAVERVVRVYVDGRKGREERFLDFFNRVGLKHFKEAVYAPA